MCKKERESHKALPPECVIIAIQFHTVFYQLFLHPMRENTTSWKIDLPLYQVNNFHRSSIDVAFINLFRFQFCQTVRER